MNAQEVLKHLSDPAIVFDADQTRKIYALYKLRSDSLARCITMSFNVGGKVSFTARGSQVAGVITRINVKTITVHVEANKSLSGRPTNWKVSPQLLIKAN